MPSASCKASPNGQEIPRLGGRGGLGDVGPHGADLRLGGGLCSQTSVDANDETTAGAISDCKDNMILKIFQEIKFSKSSRPCVTR